MELLLLSSFSAGIVLSSTGKLSSSGRDLTHMVLFLSGLGVELTDMMSSILTELQVIVLALKLPVAICKHFYNKCYSNVICLYCDNIKVLDHIFSCVFDATAQLQLFVDSASAWRAVFGLSYASSYVSQMLSNCLTDLELVVLLCKGFVLVNWYQEATFCFDNSKTVYDKVVEFVRGLCLSLEIIFGWSALNIVLL
ncbi:hypothetical protein G9A89_004278 [Geosiphon pyriformis]|nr:hypothetical protein G9A89_004278 [Geosiphon pyriformis]